MQVYVQKSTRVTFPRRSAAVSGDELSQPVAPSKPGRWPSADNGAGPAWRRTPNKLTAHRRLRGGHRRTRARWAPWLPGRGCAWPVERGRRGRPFGPPRRGDEPAEVDEILFRHLDAERTDLGCAFDRCHVDLHFWTSHLRPRSPRPSRQSTRRRSNDDLLRSRNYPSTCLTRSQINGSTTAH